MASNNPTRTISSIVLLALSAISYLKCQKLQRILLNWSHSFLQGFSRIFYTFSPPHPPPPTTLPRFSPSHFLSFMYPPKHDTPYFICLSSQENMESLLMKKLNYVFLGLMYQ
jgi:hypothetical protein